MYGTIKRGEIYYADLSGCQGSEQGGSRPVLIIQNDVGNKYSPTTLIAPLTSKLSKNNYRYMFFLTTKIMDLDKSLLYYLNKSEL